MNGASDFGPFARALLAFVVYVGGGVVVGMALANLFSSAEGAFRTELTGIGTLGGLCALIAFARLSPPPAAWGGKVLRGLAIYFVGLLVWLPVAFWIYPAILDGLGESFEAQPSLLYFAGESATAWGFVAMLALACIVAPVGEEILFRGYVQGAFASVAPRGVALLITAGLFGLQHGLLYAFPLALLGLVFGIVRERCGGLLAPAVVHATHNTLTLAALFLFPELIEVFQ